MPWMPNLSDDDYFTLPELSSSQLKDLLSHGYQGFLAKKQEPLTPTPSMILGTELHEFVFFHKEPSAKNKDKVHRMYASLLCHPEATALLMAREAIYEQPGVVAEFEQVGVRIKPDIRLPSAIVDLKTTTSADFPRAIFNLSYDLQAAFYLDVASHLENYPLQNFFWIVCQSSAPYLTRVYSASDALLARGRMLYRQAILTYKQKIDPSLKIEEVGVPSWL